MGKNGYTSINLPTALVEELKIWRMAFNNAYGKPISYGEMIRGMLVSLEDSDPDVVNELDVLCQKHPEFMEKLANYRGEKDEVKL